MQGESTCRRLKVTETDGGGVPTDVFRYVYLRYVVGKKAQQGLFL